MGFQDEDAYFSCSDPTFLNSDEKKKIYKSNKIVKCFLVSFLLVNGRRNWGQLNKWAVLHFPSNIVQITCHCYNEKEHTILPNVTWRAKVQSYCAIEIQLYL